MIICSFSYRFITFTDNSSLISTNALQSDLDSSYFYRFSSKNYRQHKSCNVSPLNSFLKLRERLISSLKSRCVALASKNILQLFAWTVKEVVLIEATLYIEH